MVSTQQEAPAVDIERLGKDLEFLRSVDDSRLPLVTKRTLNFIQRTRRIRDSSQMESYFVKVKDRRNFRKRKTPTKPGERCHIRNYRPQIPTLSGFNPFSSFSGLESILDSTATNNINPFYANGSLYVKVLDGNFKGTYLVGRVEHMKAINPQSLEPLDSSRTMQALLNVLLNHDRNTTRYHYQNNRFYVGYQADGHKTFFQLELKEEPAHVDSKTLWIFPHSATQVMLYYTEDGIKDIPKYSRKYLDEKPQTMPKIPWREISSLRNRPNSTRKAEYMQIDYPIDYQKHRGFYSETEVTLFLGVSEPRKGTSRFSYTKNGRSITKVVKTWAYRATSNIGH